MNVSWIKELVLAGKVVRKGKMTIKLNAETQEVEMYDTPHGDLGCPVAEIERAAEDFLGFET